MRRVARFIGSTRFLVVGAVLTLAMVAAAVFVTVGAAKARSVDSTAQDARDFAVENVPKVLSYDYNTIDTHFAEALDLLGGEFRGQFDDVSKRVIVPSAKQRQVVTNAAVVESSVISSTENDARLLLFVNQTTTSADAPATKLDGSRVQVTVARSGDGWLLTEMKPV